MSIFLFCNVEYTFGTEKVIFDKTIGNVKLTNGLCNIKIKANKIVIKNQFKKIKKKLFDCENNIICEEDDVISILYIHNYGPFYVNSRTPYVKNNILYTFHNNKKISCHFDRNYKYSIVDDLLVKSEQKYFDDNIEHLLTRLNDNENNIDIYVINLKHRTDRLERVMKEFEKLDFVNLVVFNAYNADFDVLGWKMCILSNFSLINYAKKNNLPYIIVIEDDCIPSYNIPIEEYKETINFLIDNKDKFNIFNGGPGIDLKTIIKKSFSDNYYLASETCIFCHFMLYSNSCYDCILEDYKFNDIYGLSLDRYYSKYFDTLIFNKYLFMQFRSYSDLDYKIKNYEGHTKKFSYKLETILDKNLIK